MAHKRRLLKLASDLCFLLAGGLLLSTVMVSREQTATPHRDPAATASLHDVAPASGGMQRPAAAVLRDATIRDWHAAGEQDRLDAATDLVIAAGAPQDGNELHNRAGALARCIDEATRDGIMDNAMVADVAAACLQLLGR